MVDRLTNNSVYDSRTYFFNNIFLFPFRKRDLALNRTIIRSLRPLPHLILQRFFNISHLTHALIFNSQNMVEFIFSQRRLR